MRSLFFGKNRGIKSDLGFRIMSWIFVVRDRFMSPWKILDKFGIQKGQTVVDYGCGPGSYLKRASELVGPKGTVVAVDVHKSAIKAVRERILKERLTNVTPVRAEINKSSLKDKTANVVYALDMFHMVAKPDIFLRELSRICKDKGFLFIDNGHQSRKEARSKINSSGAWKIDAENRRYMKCVPIKNILKEGK